MKTTNMVIKRVIVDYQKLNDEILELLVEKFPEGYEESDIVAFRNAKYEYIEAVEVRSEDTMYLVKVSKRLADTMENFDSDGDNNEGDNEQESLDLELDDELEKDFDENL